MAYGIQEVIPLALRREVAQIDCQDKFMFRPERGWKWLQRLCYWILRKVGAYAIDSMATYTRVVIDRPTAMQALIAQRNDLLDMYHQRGEVVLVGPEALDDMFKEVGPMLRQPLRFDLPYFYGIQVLDMHVVVVPWMRGILVVPKGVLTHGPA